MYHSFFEPIQMLSVKDKALLLDMMFLYSSTGQTPEIKSQPLKILWATMRQQFDRDLLKYKNVVERNKNNGAKGGRPKKNNSENPLGYLETQEKQEEPKKADTVSVSVSETDSTTEKRMRFIPPTSQEVKEYVSVNNYSVNEKMFIDYYTSNGWKVGKNTMKDWKAAVRNWNERNKKETTFRHPATDIFNDADLNEQLKKF